jgi:hypothetical protein
MMKATIFVYQLLAYQMAPPGQPLADGNVPGKIVSPSSTVTIMVLDLAALLVLEFTILKESKYE